MTSHHDDAALVMRAVRDEDADGIAAIYDPLVRESAITFELEPPGPEGFRERIRTLTRRYPWIVLVRQDVVVGYAYSGVYRARPAYDWSTETSLYLRSDARGRGLGRRLYENLFAILRLQGFIVAIGGVTLPNAASVRLHESMGFQSAGVVTGCGYKHGGWWDVGFWRLQLRPAASPPPTIKPFGEMRDAVDAALRSGTL
jgi:L-amino acid N-acyltransferase YncA